MKLEANKDPQSSTMTSTKQLYFEHFFHVKDSLVLRNGLKNTLVGCTLHILSKTHTVGPYTVQKSRVKFSRSQTAPNFQQDSRPNFVIMFQQTYKEIKLLCQFRKPSSSSSSVSIEHVVQSDYHVPFSVPLTQLSSFRDPFSPPQYHAYFSTTIKAGRGRLFYGQILT